MSDKDLQLVSVTQVVCESLCFVPLRAVCMFSTVTVVKIVCVFVCVSVFMCVSASVCASDCVSVCTYNLCSLYVDYMYHARTLSLMLLNDGTSSLCSRDDRPAIDSTRR